MEPVALEDLGQGEHGIVATMVDLPGSTRQRLLEMGMTTGTRLRLVRRAPFGDPIEIHVKGCHLMLRCTEARRIFVFREGEA